MRRFATAAVVALAVAIAGCDGAPDDERQASPTVVAPSATSVAGRTPTATPAPLSASGTALYVRDGRIWMGRLDGTSERDVTPPDLAADPQLRTLRYAGAMMREGGPLAYFTAQFGEPPENDGSGQVEITLAVYAGTLDAGPVTPLLRFNTTRQSALGASSHAAVSPDGRYVAFVTDEGLHLFDVAAGTSRRLLTNRPKSATNTPGTAFVDPVWSPDGEWLAMTRHADGDPTDAVVDFIRPLEPITEYTGDAGGRTRWSADASHVCIEVSGVARVGIMDVADRRFMQLAPGTDATSCAWSPGGSPSGGRRVAVGYIDPAAPDAATRFRIYDVFDTGHVPTAELAPGLHGAGVTAWLPDGTGIIVVHGVGEERPQSKIVRLDGTVHRLAVDADYVIATYP